MNIILVPNIIESNGKTVRQNNMEIMHNIPLGSLVEVSGRGHRIRVFVVEHQRDCDGTPLYGLGMSSDLSEYEKTGHEGIDLAIRFKISGGWDEESLTVIEQE